MEVDHCNVPAPMNFITNIASVALKVRDAEATANPPSLLLTTEYAQSYPLVPNVMVDK
jgi:hypothetical protein